MSYAPPPHVAARHAIHDELPRPRWGVVAVEAAHPERPIVLARIGRRLSITWHARETGALAAHVARLVLGLVDATAPLPVAEHRPEWGKPERLTLAAHTALSTGRSPPPPVVPKLPLKLKMLAVVPPRAPEAGQRR